jgi:glycosyltransferase involved in cell wall biosynthesis
MPLFTVFTPAYNRAHTLHRAWESLKAQTLRDFEWLVIDDGSTDGTRELMERYQQEADFPVRYIQEPHRGAWAVHNVSLRESKGRFWIKLDSDDGCMPRALERLLFHWESIPEAQRGRFSGVTGLCRDQDGNLVGTKYPRDPLDCSAAELEYRHKVRGEKWGFLRLDVVRRFPFPEDLSGHYIPESVVWCQVSKDHLTRHVNEVVRIYWTDAPSLVHGRPDPRRNAAGHRLWCRTVLDLESRWFFTAPLRLLRAAALYTRFSLHTGAGIPRQFGELSSWGGRLLWLAALPVGAALWLRDQFWR